VLRIVVRDWIILACDLQVVADRWMDCELALVVVRVILMISSKGVKSGGIQWKLCFIKS